MEGAASPIIMEGQEQHGDTQDQPENPLTCLSPYFDEMTQRSAKAQLTKRFCMSTYFQDQPLMDTMQGGEAWFRARSQITITASNFASVMGLLPFETSQKAYNRILSVKEAQFDSAQWQNITWGKEMEGVARQYLRDNFFPEIREVGTFIYKRLSLLEIKCPAKETNFAQKGIPIWNLLQLYGEMAATGVDNTVFMSWLPRKFSLFWVTFDRTIWDQYLYPKLKYIVDSIHAKRSWEPRMTVWKDQLENLNQLLSHNVFKICEYKDLPAPQGGLQWNLRNLIPDGANITLDPSDLPHVQSPSTEGIPAHLNNLARRSVLPTKRLKQIVPLTKPIAMYAHQGSTSTASTPARTHKVIQAGKETIHTPPTTASTITPETLNNTSSEVRNVLASQTAAVYISRKTSSRRKNPLTRGTVVYTNSVNPSLAILGPQESDRRFALLKEDNPELPSHIIDYQTAFRHLKGTDPAKLRQHLARLDPDAAARQKALNSRFAQSTEPYVASPADLKRSAHRARNMRRQKQRVHSLVNQLRAHDVEHDEATPVDE
jgi:hypothetical protein